MKRRTFVLGRSIPVKPGKSQVMFHAGRVGLRERGRYYFWTIVMVRRKWPRRFNATGRSRSTVRDAGERFRRGPSAISRRFYDETRPLFARPASWREISAWMGSHIDDAKHVSRLRRFQPFIRRRPWHERWLKQQGAPE